MNLFLLTNRRHGVRKVQLTSAQGIAALSGLALSLVGTGVFLGASQAVVYRFQAEQELRQLRAEVAHQSSEFSALRASVDDTLDAFAAQMGTLSARLIRLDALGGRLTQVAGLEDGEFDFSAPPAMGGPAVLVESDEYGGLPPSEYAVLQDLLDIRERIDDRARQFEALESMLRLRDVQARVEPNGPPVDEGWISSYYGRRTDPFTATRSFHSGIDFAGREGMEVKAVADGVISFVGRRSGYGNIVEISHGNGLVTRYAHNKRNLVAVGDRTAKGEVIALMGSTGRATGPNLHFEVLQHGRSVNPLSYVKGTR